MASQVFQDEFGNNIGNEIKTFYPIISDCKIFFVETENKVWQITTGNDGFDIKEMGKSR